MHTEDSHPDAGMDLMFGRRADPRITQDERYKISHPKVPRRERASVQMLGILFLVLMLAAVQQLLEAHSSSCRKPSAAPSSTPFRVRRPPVWSCCVRPAPC